MDAGGTATTECPPNRGSEWKHESPDFSRGESQFGVHLNVQVDAVFLMPFPAGCLAAPSDTLLKPSAKTGCFFNDSLFEPLVEISLFSFEYFWPSTPAAHIIVHSSCHIIHTGFDEMAKARFHKDVDF